MPTRRTCLACCASDAIGQAAAPPRILRNSRRLIAHPRAEGSNSHVSSGRGSRARLQSPLWVKSRHLQCKPSCPLYPPNSGHFGEADDLCSVLARSTELGFDEFGEGKNRRPHPLHSDLFQNRLELLTKLVKGRSRLPNIDHAPAARHRPGNVRE